MRPDSGCLEVPVREGTGWQTLERVALCETPHLRVFCERVATPSRPDGVDWVVARRRQAAVIAPRTESGTYLLVRQERVAVRSTLWEFPAGQVEGPVTEETIRATALRELGEEAGVECRGDLVALGGFFSSAGFTDEQAHLFLATGVTPRPEGTDPDEHEAIVEVGEFSAGDLRRMIAAGEVADANTLAVFARLTARDLLE